MRQITIDSIRAFRNGTPFKRGNMQVHIYFGIDTFGSRCMTKYLKLHGNIIAKLSNEGLVISTCGWNTVTTRERLNGLPGVHVVQRKGELFLNGEVWDGSKKHINADSFFPIEGGDEWFNEPYPRTDNKRWKGE
jgi:hypothetical protein